MSRPEHQQQHGQQGQHGHQNQPQHRTPEIGSGFLEIAEKGFGFLRSIENKFQPKPTDVFVTPDCIKKNLDRKSTRLNSSH